MGGLRLPSAQLKEQGTVSCCLETQAETKGEEQDPESEDLGGAGKPRRRTQAVDLYLEPLTLLLPCWKRLAVVVSMLAQGFLWNKPF